MHRRLSTRFRSHSIVRRCCVRVRVLHDGTFVCLCGRDGREYARLSLPGDVYSSPVAVGSQILVGCRDSHLYCLQVHTRPTDSAD